jgi:hypothetical protein
LKLKGSEFSQISFFLSLIDWQKRAGLPALPEGEKILFAKRKLLQLGRLDSGWNILSWAVMIFVRRSDRRIQTSFP